MSRVTKLSRAALLASVGVLTLPGCGLSALVGTTVALSAGKSSSGGGVPSPIVNGITPGAGPHAGGTTVTITGGNFPLDATVTMGGIAATGVTVQDGSTLSCQSPRSTSVGPVDVVVASAVGGTGTLSGAFVYTNGAAVAVVSSISSPQAQNIVFSFTLSQPASDPIDVTVDVDTGAGSFTAAPSSALVSGGLTSLSSSPTGVLQTVTFDSRVLFPNQNAANVRLRVTPRDTVDGTTGTPGVSNAFLVQNNSAPLLQLIQNASDSFNVVVNYVVTNADPNDAVNVTALRWRNESTGATGPMTLSTLTASQGLGPCPFSSTGARVRTIWDSVADVGFGNNRLVTVTVAISDGNYTATATSQPFFLSNGPVTDQALFPVVGLNDGFAVGDLTRDGKVDLVSGRIAPANGPGSQGTINVLVNRGRTFNNVLGLTPPFMSPAAFPNPASPPQSLNPFLWNVVHPSICAVLDADDTDTLGALDAVVADQYYAPGGDQPLVSNFSTAPPSILPVIAAVAQDAPSAFAHVIAHQVTMTAVQSANVPDVANAVFESSLALGADMAPLVRFPGQGPSPNPPAATGNPIFDNFGWFLQDMRVENLDPPVSAGTPGALVPFQTARSGFRDLVMVDAVARLGSTLTAGDVRGCVVIRQFDPATRRLGRTFYLDPADMGALPTHCAVADVLSVSRTALGAPAFMLGAKDIVVANTASCSLTFYYQLAPAPGPNAPPTFGSFQLPLRSLPGFAGLPNGDTSSVVAGDLNGDGANDLVVIGQLSKTAIVFLYDPNPATPGSLVTATGGALPFRIATVLPLPELLCGRPAIADVTGDGQADLLVPSKITNELLIYANLGNNPPGAAPAPPGTPAFQRARFAADLQPFAAATADLNGDGRSDVVVGNHLSLDFSVYYQTTPGTLDERFTPVATGTSPTLIASGDVTGDGVPEVVVPNSGDNTVTVFARDPVAGLVPIRTYSTALPGASQPFECRVADVTGDGLNDIFVSMQFALQPGGKVDGGFEVIPATPLGAGVATLRSGNFISAALSGAVGDLNKDGIPDAVLTSVQGEAVTVFSGTATPFAYVRAQATLPGRAPRQVTIVDLDGDTWNDVVVTVSRAVFVFYNNGDGTLNLASPTIYDTTGFVDPVGLAVGDLDGDGRLDILLGGFVNGDGAALFQTGPRAFTPVSLVVGSPPTGVAIGDLNGDGLLDAVVTWTAVNQVAVYYQRPDKTGIMDALAAPVTYTTASSPYGCVIVDVDGDARNDLVVSARGASSLNIFFQR